MGINAFTYNFFLDTIKEQKFNPKKSKLVELGNQHFKWTLKKKGVAKKEFKKMGFDHISFDINGKDGAINIDLQKEITDVTYLKSFDILTNFGTIEHIDYQYNTWKNVHNLVKQGGLMFHLLPFVDNKVKHGKYAYSIKFFEKLSALMHYNLLNVFTEYGGHKKLLIYASMIKTKDNEFISEKQFNNNLQKLYVKKKWGKNA